MDEQQSSPAVPKTSWRPIAGAIALSVTVGVGGYEVGYHTHRPPPAAAVYFSPKGGCTQAITRAINAAKSEVLVQAYYFTSTDIADALIRANMRGLRVLVLMDKSCQTDPWSLAGYLSNQGVIVRVDDDHAIAHNKIVIIDSQTVFTGSFNFTKAAEESNAENLLELGNPETISQYKSNWESHWQHSKQFNVTAVAVAPDPITPEAAATRDGQRCTVEMKVAKVGTNRNNPDQLFLNSRGYYKQADNFTIVLVPAATPKKFDGWTSFKSYLLTLEGKTVRVVGVVSRYDGRPEIKVGSPDQLLLLPDSH